MEFWNQVLTTAILGTEKHKLREDALPAALAHAAAVIRQNKDEKEDRFLQLAAAAYNYRRCGFLPLNREESTLQKAAAEQKSPCSPLAAQVLYAVLETVSLPLLQLWLAECSARGWIVPPEALPTLLDKGTKHPVLQTDLRSCMGNRGHWLLRLNDEWQFEPPQPDETAWETGTLAQRLAALRAMRNSDPENGRSWLLGVWPRENAAMRAALLPALEIGIGKEDEPWLKSLLAEKSVKVREEAWRLLKLIPDSDILHLYANVLQQSVQLKKEKALLGLGTKATLAISLAAVEEVDFQSGIEKLSSTKETMDEEYILYQLVQQVPPHNWGGWLQLAAEEIVLLFARHKQGKKLLPAVADAAYRFRSMEWALALTRVPDQFYPQLLAVLPLKEWEQYSEKHIEEHPYEVLHSALERSHPWSPELAKKILQFTAKNGYQYHRGFYNGIVHLLPGEIIPELEECTPSERYQQELWSRNKEYIIQLVALKTQLHNAFHT